MIWLERIISQYSKWEFLLLKKFICKYLSFKNIDTEHKDINILAI